MITTLIGKIQDDEALASDGSLDGKGATFSEGRVADELENNVGNVGSDGVCGEGTIDDVIGVVEEGNLAKSAEERPPILKEYVKDEVYGEDFLVKREDVAHEDGHFTIGDIVWCMAKNNIWWPALICEPLDVPKQFTKNWDSEKLLVRHFGSKTMIWCPPSRLKHFLESFKEMSSQGKSISFLGAIEKAAEELGRRVKLEMSCSCISKEIRARLIGRNKEDFKPWYIINDNAARHFDPTRFLEQVKNLAMMSNVPDIVEIVSTRSSISAYYSYFGHSQMYLRHLRDTNGPNSDLTAMKAEEGGAVSTEHMEEGSDLGTEMDGQSLDSLMIEESPKLGSEGTAEKEFESRERKKSKYLSFPFVNPSASKSLRNSVYSSEASGRRNTSSSKRLLEKNSKKLTASTSSGDLKDLKVSSAQLLTELCDTSRGYFYLNGNSILHSTFDFFCEFRRHTFNDGDSASIWSNKHETFDKGKLEVQVGSPLSETKPAKKRMKSLVNSLEALNSEPTMEQVKDMTLKACGGTPVGNGLPTCRKRKESTGANHQTDNSDGVLDLNSNGSSPRPSEKSSDKGKVSEVISESKKKKSMLESNVERHFGETTASLNANTTPISSLPDNVNHGNSIIVKIPAQMELLPTGVNSDTKLKNPSLAENSSGLPDLNGNGHDPTPTSSITFPSKSIPFSMISTSHLAAKVEEPPLSVIKSNLEMMSKMLEDSGKNISPDMRSKLEHDVQGLLKKITDMTSSSS